MLRSPTRYVSRGWLIRGADKFAVSGLLLNLSAWSCRMRAYAFSCFARSPVSMASWLSNTARSIATLLSGTTKRAYASPRSISGAVTVPNFRKFRSELLCRVSAMIDSAFCAVSRDVGLSEVYIDCQQLLHEANRFTRQARYVNTTTSWRIRREVLPSKAPL